MGSIKRALDLLHSGESAIVIFTDGRDFQGSGVDPVSWTSYRWGHRSPEGGQRASWSLPTGRGCKFIWVLRINGATWTSGRWRRRYDPNGPGCSHLGEDRMNREGKPEEVGRPIQIMGMAYAPTNEQGVVFLFGRLAPNLGFQIERIQSGFPDCLARRRRKNGWISRRVEFEYRASAYKGHPPRGADVVVCWENDWERRPRRYRHLEIIDLKTHVGASPRVFAVGCDELVRGYALDRWSRVDWSVPANAQVDDLIVMYRTRPASEIRDLWKVVGPFYDDPKWGLEAYLRVVVLLRKPITYQHLKVDPTTRGLAVVRGRFQGKRDITDGWPLLYNEIVALNPIARKALREYQPD